MRTVSEQELATLNDWFCERHVLVFPGQELTPEEQMTFAQHWGELVRHPYAGLDEYPYIIELRNMGKGRDVNEHWHTDMSFNPAPPKLTMLYAHSAPDFGGDTAFANQELAYEALSPAMRDVLDGLQAEHVARGLAKLYQESLEDAPSAVHPVVRTHDETGRKALYVCWAFTEKFVGWTRDESQPLLQWLYRHCVRPEFQARHHWRAGDLVMWDNRCLQHFAVHDHADDQPRLIHRVQVQ